MSVCKTRLQLKHIDRNPVMISPGCNEHTSWMKYKSIHDFDCDLRALYAWLAEATHAWQNQLTIGLKKLGYAVGSDLVTLKQ